jgi:hypothetical protein
VEQTDPDGEDHVEPPVAEVGVLEARNQELGCPSLDMLGISPGGGLDHLRRAVDRRQPAVAEPLTDHRCGDAVAAADLEHAVVGRQLEPLHDRCQPLAHHRYETESTRACDAMCPGGH